MHYNINVVSGHIPIVHIKLWCRSNIMGKISINHIVLLSDTTFVLGINLQCTCA